MREEERQQQRNKRYEELTKLFDEVYRNRKTRNLDTGYWTNDDSDFDDDDADCYLD